MAVKIRLKRLGAKKKPFYRLVVADSRSPRNGRFIEEIGYYNPVSTPKQFKVDSDKVKSWISNGAKPTDTVMGLLKKYEVLSAEGIVASGLPEVKKPAEKASKKNAEVKAETSEEETKEEAKMEKDEKKVEELKKADEQEVEADVESEDEKADIGEVIPAPTDENVEQAIADTQSAFVEQQKVDEDEKDVHDVVEEKKEEVAEEPAAEDNAEETEA